MDSKQFAWAYLLKNGNFGIEKSYYGGYKPIEDDYEKKFGSIWNFDTFQKANSFALKELKEIGIDWKKTNAPSSDYISLFNGTFNDPKDIEYISGTLVLKNGKTQNWMVEGLEVTNVFDMMAQAHEIESEFSFLLGLNVVD